MFIDLKLQVAVGNRWDAVTISCSFSVKGLESPWIKMTSLGWMQITPLTVV